MALKVDAADDTARAFFQPRLQVQLVPLNIPVADPETAQPELRLHLRREDAVARLASSVAGKGQIVEARGSLLFAHPRSDPRLDLPSIHALRVSYGIFPDAWTGERHTDGVCFRITLVPMGGKPLKVHEQCLTPLERVADRAEQEFAIRLDQSQPAALVLETECRDTCSWDWAYWKDIDVTP